MVVALVEVALEFAPATLVSSINNMVTVAGVADVALEADDLGAPGAPGVRASSLVLDGFPLFSPPPPALGQQHW